MEFENFYKLWNVPSIPSFFSAIYPPPRPNVGLILLGTYNPKAHWPDAIRRSNRLWARILGRYMRAGPSEFMVSTMSGPSPQTTQDRTQTKDTHPAPG